MRHAIPALALAASGIGCQNKASALFDSGADSGLIGASADTPDDASGVPDAPTTTDYGVISSDGYPNWSERQLHSWTNAIRVDPEAFAELYQPCTIDDFEEDQRWPKGLLYYDFNLNDAARFHTDDMATSGVFSHSSSDGTEFGDRLARFYGESAWIGENIAAGYGDSASALFDGWMCSEGHRYNIMLGEYNELGTGVMSLHYTQDFAVGNIVTASPVAMAVHEPESPSTEVSFMADWESTVPTRIEVVLNGIPLEMGLIYGTETLGVYTADALPEPGCNSYYIYWETDSASGTFPETGSYTFGICEDSIPWTAEQIPVDGEDDADTGESKSDGCGCSAAHGSNNAAGWLVGLLGFLLYRRR